MPTPTAATAPQMIVRRMAFPHPVALKGQWNPARPEFSHMVNAGSLGMPFLEPWLIATMRQAKAQISDPRLLAEIDPDKVAGGRERDRVPERVAARLRRDAPHKDGT